MWHLFPKDILDWYLAIGYKKTVDIMVIYHLTTRQKHCKIKSDALDPLCYSCSISTNGAKDIQIPQIPNTVITLTSSHPQ